MGTWLQVSQDEAFWRWVVVMAAPKCEHTECHPLKCTLNNGSDGTHSMLYVLNRIHTHTKEKATRVSRQGVLLTQH